MRRTLGSLGVAGALLVGATCASAHDLHFPIAGKLGKVKADSSANPRARRFVFRAVRQALIAPSLNPGVYGSALYVSGKGANAGHTGIITLNPGYWQALGAFPGSAGYKYSDPTGSSGGVKKVLLKPGPHGGKLIIVAGGPNWPWTVSGPQDELLVHFKVEDEWYCAEFNALTDNAAGFLLGKDAPAPADCSESCGNGIVELDNGEQCDDGNLNDTDGCTSACQIASCEGETFNSTWEALQSKIIQDGGCTSIFCHTGAAPGGGLDLAPANAYANLVNVPATQSLPPGLNRILPGDQDSSYFYLKLAAKTLAPNGPPVDGSPMPAGGIAAISSDYLAALAAWIRAGAPETTVVDGTAQLLGSCLPPASPQKIPPLDPPAFGTGVQLYAPPWDLPAQSEHEVCYATYYDLSLTPGLVPASAQTPCPSFMGGPSRTCFRYHQQELAQDPQSHHSIIHAYTGSATTSDVGWGTWTCKGGPMAGSPCDPTGIGVAAPAGADCGSPRSGCTSSVVNTVACVGFGPTDYNATTAPSFGGSQESLSGQTYASGVYNVVPMKGIIVWNSHAFNLTQFDTTMEQYYNLLFAAPADQLYQVQAIFDATDIFVEDVPPFQTREYCRTFTLPQNAHLFSLSSHTHKRGKRFRMWGPPNSSCDATNPACVPNAGSPLYLSTEYTDPVQLRIEPPMLLSSAVATDRTFKFCSLYDNGATDPTKVKRRSTSPDPPAPIFPGGKCDISETECIGGTKQGQLCNGSNSFCDSSPGMGDGDCDACPLRGGVTTEDEMFIALGSYY